MATRSSSIFALLAKPVLKLSWDCLSTTAIQQAGEQTSKRLQQDIPS